MLRQIYGNIKISEDDWNESGFAKFCFEPYYLLAAMFKPKKILEIGTRRGYSLIAMFKGYPQVEFIWSCDNESYEKGSQGVALGNLVTSGWQGNDRFVTASSYTDEFKNAINDKTFDLIHIDAAHDYPDVVHDLELTLPVLSKDGVMLVHDYTYILDVKKAVDEFAVKYNLNCLLINSYRGLAVLQRRVK